MVFVFLLLSVYFFPVWSTLSFVLYAFGFTPSQCVTNGPTSVGKQISELG